MAVNDALLCLSVSSSDVDDRSCIATRRDQGTKSEFPPQARGMDKRRTKASIWASNSLPFLFSLILSLSSLPCLSLRFRWRAGEEETPFHRLRGGNEKLKERNAARIERLFAHLHFFSTLSLFSTSSSSFQPFASSSLARPSWCPVASAVELPARALLLPLLLPLLLLRTLPPLQKTRRSSPLSGSRGAAAAR